MVESQVRTNDVSDIDLINAISNTRREVFVREEEVNFAYSELNVASLSGRPLLKPRDFSKLAQALDVQPTDEVLIIAGSGCYSAAVLALLGAKVVVFDEAECGLDVCDFVLGELETLAELDGRQFDVVFVDQGVETIPSSWLEAIRDGGRMGIVQSQNGIGKACLYLKTGEYISSRILFETQVPMLQQFNMKLEFEF